MAKPDPQTSRQVLSLHQGKKLQTSEHSVVRRALTYGPRYEPTVNVERLPEVSQLADMDLAYREQPLSDPEIREATESQLSAAMLTAVAVSLLFAIILPLVPWQMLLVLGSVASAVFVYVEYRRSAFAFERLLAALFLPLFGAVIAKGVALLVARPVILASVLAIVTVLYFNEQATRPFRFYRRWLFTEPRLKPHTRQRQSDVMPQPAILIMFGLLAVGVLVPLVGNWLAMLGIAAGSLIWIGGHTVQLSWPRMKGQLRQLGGQLRKVFAQYLNYGRFSSWAAGVWYAEQTVQQRRQVLFFMCVLPTLTLAVALDGFMPWDMPIVESRFRKVCVEEIATDGNLMESLQWLTPHFDWSKVPQLPEFVPARTLPRSVSKGISDKSHREFERKYGEALLEYNRRLEEDELLEYQESLWPHFKSALDSASYVPFLVAAIGLVSGHLSFVWLFALALALAGILPVLLIVATFVPLLKDAAVQAETVDTLDVDERPEWQWYVDRIRSSQHEARGPLGEKMCEGEHLFLGVEPEADFPVLLDKQILSEHAYIVGDSGSGKTSLGLMPLLTQLIRGDTSGEPQAKEDPNLAPPPPIVILDLKGDMALFQSVRQEVERRSPDDPDAFMYFTPEQGLDSCYFNPFKSLISEKRSLLQLCQLLLDSLGLNHGEGYGRSYFSRRSRQTLFKALKQQPQPQSIEALYERLSDKSFMKEFKDKKDVFELLATVEALAQYPQLAVGDPQASQERVIHMPRVLQTNQVVYFWLPSALESVTVREIGKLALFSLLTAAIDRQRAGLPKRQAYLVIDEFQRIASENFKIILEQARSFGISAILANQTRSDLKLHDVDLRTTVNTNTRYKQFFSVTDASEAAELTEMSGEELGYQVATSHMATRSPSKKMMTTVTETRTETIKPKLTKNDILGISDHPLDSVLQISRGSGYSQFGGASIHLRSTWPMTKGKYEKLAKRPWPSRAELDEASEADRPVVVQSDQPPSDIEQSGYEKMVERREAALAKLYEENLPKNLED